MIDNLSTRLNQDPLPLSQHRSRSAPIGNWPVRRAWIVLGGILFGIAAARPAWSQFGGPASVQVERVRFEEVAAGQEFVGTVVPIRTAVVGSAVDGRVIDFPVNEGDRV
jgi:multidrug efflux pump subunit AcrA (membrane-fusion protein)